jgi:FkbM family methyltransferase
MKPLQAIFFRDINADFVSNIMNEMFLERIYDPYLVGKKDLTVIDAGANIGLFTYYIYPISKKIYSLEPSKIHFKTLSEMIRYNRLDRTEVVNLGLSNASGDRVLYSSSNTTAFSLYKVDPYSNETENVQMVTLNDFLLNKNLTKVDVLKIDIEGEEAKVFSSSEFDKAVPKLKMIFYEWHEWSGVSKEQVKFMLQDRGFKVHQIPTRADVFIAERKYE